MARRSDRHHCSPNEPRESSVPTREDEAALVQRARNAPPGDPSLHELVMSNLPFVIKVASEYRNLGLPREDLVNEGNLGVIEAARRFDPGRGTRFLTYAVWWIRRSMLRALARQASLVHVPAYQMQKLRHAVDVGRRLSKELGRQADREEISREMQVGLAAVDDILRLRSRELSLDEPVGRDRDMPLSDGLADERTPDPEHAMIRNEQAALVRWALQALDDEERTIIVQRFGLEGGTAPTLREMGKRLGVSHERIRQIEDRAKRRLRKAIAWQLRPYAVSRPSRDPVRRETVRPGDGRRLLPGSAGTR